MKSCLPSAAVLVLLVVLEVEVLVVEVLVVFVDAGGVVALLTLVVVVLVVVVVLLALAGAVDVQAAETSNAAVKAASNTIVFILLDFLIWGEGSLLANLNCIESAFESSNLLFLFGKS
jgi:hypothetical protein